MTHFKSLTLENLEAALYSVHKQDVSHVKEIILLDNASDSSTYEVQRVVDSLRFEVPVRVLSIKHSDPLKTHAWSTNIVVGAATTPWVLFTRADYLLHFDLVQKFVEVAKSHDYKWNGFIVGNGCHLSSGVQECEQTEWRQYGPQIFRGAEFDYTEIDAGVWMAKLDTFQRVLGLDEALASWGHAQTHFQWKMYKAGTHFVRIPETLFWHPYHGAQRDIELAHAECSAQGFDLKEMWTRYRGVQPY